VDYRARVRGELPMDWVGAGAAGAAGRPPSVAERLRVWRLRVSKRGISPVHSVSESSDTDPEAHLRAILSEADCAFTHLSDPTTLTATSEKETRKGFPSAVPE